MHGDGEQGARPLPRALTSLAEIPPGFHQCSELGPEKALELLPKALFQVREIPKSNRESPQIELGEESIKRVALTRVGPNQVQLRNLRQFRQIDLENRRDFFSSSGVEMKEKAR